MERRNPYLILGIPFGTGRAGANAAFARRVKSLPADPAQARAWQTDLTWALQRIDAGPAAPEAEMGYYRMPADPGCGAPGEPGVFAPPPEPGPYDEAAVAAALVRLRAEAAREALRRELSRRSAQTPPPAP
ncbi:hypothetical protein [Paractinoplanes atraurantiacus]|uniref:Uncharacterized protein n=1 Tax=Paractinoplanes atraurantiacus TaxID=1036182 RepID=A0A285JY53_9ACTN|nr:hypothetical protein [Actinoplanes atraurantiacus]SNY65249.1 hypothetical protein SAMN05421748_12811 [Actinoplanes atraurantiacus]